MNHTTLILIALVLTVCESAKRCTPGNYIAKSGDCLPCPRGSHQPRANKNACKPCPPNKIAAKEGSIKCTACPKNSEPASFRHKCICVEGTAKSGGKCRKCKPGTFFRLGSCQDCSPGYFQSKPGQLDCLACPLGAFSGYAATECVTCADDEDFHVNDGVCVKCSAGYVHDKYSGCVQCERNTFKPKAGSGACLPCPPNTHSKPGSRKCKRCPKGTAPLKKGKCGSCAGGEYYDKYNRKCAKCGFNQFTPRQNVRTSCYSCSEKRFALEGSIKCVRCPKRKFLMKDGKCRSCPKGTVFARYDLACRICGVNQFTRGDKQYCESCPTGTYAYPGSTTCFTCKKGTALILKKKKDCAKCPPGREYSRYDATCNLCYEGSAKKTAGIQGCTSCPAGKNSNDDRTECVPVD